MQSTYFIEIHIIIYVSDVISLWYWYFCRQCILSYVTYSYHLVSYSDSPSLPQGFSKLGLRWVWWETWIFHWFRFVHGRSDSSKYAHQARKAHSKHVPATSGRLWFSKHRLQKSLVPTQPGNSHAKPCPDSSPSFLIHCESAAREN